MVEAYDKENHWYGWNGGECPVHPETLVSFLFMIEGVADDYTGRANGILWDRQGAFRIIKIYREPRKAREWWLNINADGNREAFESEECADKYAFGDRVECIRVREILGGGE